MNHFWIILIITFASILNLTGQTPMTNPSAIPVESKTVVFIHGLFQNPESWNQWKKYFEAKGYTCHTPSYPFHDGNPADLRSKINPKLGELTFGQVIDSLAGFIDKLPEKPILIGHSMGGLAVQKLISMDKGVMGVCIDAAPPKGVFSLKWSFLKANLPTVNPLKGNSVCLPDVKWFHYAFCNTMTMEQTEIEFNKFVVPESRNIPRSSTKADGYIDFKKPHNPLLFIAGEKDHIIPSSLNKKNFNAYKDTNSKKDFKEFAGRTHYICGQENWQEVADFILGWVKRK
ncbi:MAG: alpha/beta hydrolase [Bacteroidia bacterium]|nr:alpha/beta hydrolase [Bacteroidia bacterium]